MEPFKQLTGIVMPMDRTNIDTDSMFFMNLDLTRQISRLVTLFLINNALKEVQFLSHALILAAALHESMLHGL